MGGRPGGGSIAVLRSAKRLDNVIVARRRDRKNDAAAVRTAGRGHAVQHVVERHEAASRIGTVRTVEAAQNFFASLDRYLKDRAHVMSAAFLRNAVERAIDLREIADRRVAIVRRPSEAIDDLFVSAAQHGEHGAETGTAVRRRSVKSVVSEGNEPATRIRSIIMAGITAG